MSLSEGRIICTAGMTNVKAPRKYPLGIFQEHLMETAMCLLKTHLSTPAAQSYLTFPTAVRCGHVAEFCP